MMDVPIVGQQPSQLSKAQNDSEIPYENKGDEPTTTTTTTTHAVGNSSNITNVKNDTNTAKNGKRNLESANDSTVDKQDDKAVSKAS